MSIISNENCILILQDRKMVFEIDEDNKIIYAYDNIEDIKYQKKRSRVKEVNSELKNILELHYKISIDEYNIDRVDEVIHIPSLDDLK